MKASKSVRWQVVWRWALAIILLGAIACVDGLLAAAHADWAHSEEVLASGEPVGVGLHRSRSSGQHSIAVFGDSVFVVWYGEGSNGHGIYLSRSTDAGSTFNHVTRVDSLGVMAYGPSLALDSSGNLYVTWSDERDGAGPGDNVYFSKSLDGGDSFGPDVRVDDAGASDTEQDWPAVAVDSYGTVYVVWLDSRGEGGQGVYVSRSVDSGLTFEPSMPLPNGNVYPPLGTMPQFAPSIAAIGDGRVYVSYADMRRTYDGPDEWVVCVRHSTDAGSAFGEPVDLASTLGTFQSTSIVVSGTSDAHVGWVLNDEYMFVAHSSDGAESFSSGVQVTDRAACCFDGRVTISLATGSVGRLVVGWRDSVNTLALSETKDYGETFAPVTLLSGPGDREYPTVAMHGNNCVYVAWKDERHSSAGDIYLNKLINDPLAGITAEDQEERMRGRLVAAPNPFCSETAVVMEQGQELRPLEIYDVAGRLVKRIFGPGRIRKWDGSDDRGARAAPGVYYVVAPFRRYDRVSTVVLVR